MQWNTMMDDKDTNVAKTSAQKAKNDYMHRFLGNCQQLMTKNGIRCFSSVAITKLRQKLQDPSSSLEKQVMMYHFNIFLNVFLPIRKWSSCKAKHVSRCLHCQRYSFGFPDFILTIDVLALLFVHSTLIQVCYCASIGLHQPFAKVTSRP